MKEINLFGNLQEYPEKGAPAYKSKYQIFKQLNHYRKGTTGECCKVCEFSIGFSYNGKNYYKCKLLGISNSQSTDIRLRNVCDKFKMEEE